MRSIAWLCAALLAGVYQQASAQTAAPTADGQSIAMPSGAGLPGGKPIDIVGLHTGMTASQALPVLVEHYKLQPRNKLSVTEWKLVPTDKPYIAFARNGLFEEAGFDYLGFAASSNASGNQIVNIIREVRYAPGSEPNTEQTVAAIIQKYGKPTERTDNVGIGVQLTYGYKNGKISEHHCAGLSAAGSLYLSYRQMNEDGWYTLMNEAAERNLVQGRVSEVHTRCSAYMKIFLDRARINGVETNEAFSSLHLVFFDADRFLATRKRDAEASKELEEKAKPVGPVGTVPPKL
jgi:hypothetical protein